MPRVPSRPEERQPRYALKQSWVETQLVREQGAVFRHDRRQTRLRWCAAGV